MRELRIWETLEVDEAVFFDNNPRYAEINRIHTDTMDSRAAHLKIIHESWGNEGLRFATWQEELTLDEAIALLDSGGEQRVMSAKYLTQLSNLARRVDFETATTVYQLAQIEREKATFRIRLSEPHLSRASVMLSALLKEFDRQGSTHLRIKYTAEDRGTNSSLLREETKKRLRACIQTVGEYTFNVRTWDISFQRSHPRTRIQSQMARIEELRDNPKRSAGDDLNYTETRVRKKKHKSTTLVTESDGVEEEAAIAAVTNTHNATAEISVQDVLTSPPESPTSTRSSIPESPTTVPASPNTPTASLSAAQSLPSSSSPRVLRSQNRQPIRDTQEVPELRSARRQVPVRADTPAMQCPEGKSYAVTIQLVKKASKCTEEERQSEAWKMICGAMYMKAGDVESRRSQAMINKIWKLMEDVE